MSIKEKCKLAELDTLMEKCKDLRKKISESASKIGNLDVCSKRKLDLESQAQSVSIEESEDAKI